MQWQLVAFFAVYAVGTDSNDLVEYCKKPENKFDLICQDIVSANSTDDPTTDDPDNRAVTDKKPDRGNRGDPTDVSKLSTKTGNEQSVSRSVIALAE